MRERLRRIICAVRERPAGGPGRRLCVDASNELIAAQEAADELSHMTDELAEVNAAWAAAIKRAVELLESDTAQDYRTLSQCKAILDNAAADAVSMAWRVACGNATIAGAAPSIPSDGDTQYAVNQFLEIIK
jgi:hypothetical protein